MRINLESFNMNILISSYDTVINKIPAIEGLIAFKA